MKYDFTTVSDRSNAGSMKWQKMRNIMPDLPKDIVPLSTADMEFVAIEQIKEALKDLAENMIFGYTKAKPTYYEAVCNWMKRRHSWEICEEDIALSAGVVPALCNAVRAFTQPKDEVIVFPPVYHPFFKAVENNDRRIVESPLIKENESYRIDFADFEAKAKSAKMVIFCSPHNPVGRVWKREELEIFARICCENDLIVLCDEIHHDLIMPGFTHTVLAGINDEIAARTVTCTAPTKTFNLAGLAVSNIIFKNHDMKALYMKEVMRNLSSQLNCFAYCACETAYNKCEDWLDEVIEVIDSNRQLAEKFISERLPELHLTKLEGTYLLWLDCRALGMDIKQLEEFMHSKAMVFGDEGYVFGTGGEGFVRLNIACPQSVLSYALERLEKAIKELN